MKRIERVARVVAGGQESRVGCPDSPGQNIPFLPFRPASRGRRVKNENNDAIRG